MNIYVGNLSPNVSEEELRSAFEAFGQVSTVSIIKDKFSGDPRGFAFVEMPTTAEAQAAISSLNGKELSNRALSVNEARPRSEGGHSGGGRSFGGGFGGGRPSGGGYRSSSGPRRGGRF
ncbi:MAG: RNA-binding protein [Candidatus Marinimicrobia bacterium CG08_land_8_20_14_0_20_45_22]|nr:MAG: RNA-binding protein [Candidatus Marinimicrobia bacterium CG08_land_8_20_14_0_20_45_22]